MREHRTLPVDRRRSDLSLPAVLLVALNIATSDLAQRGGAEDRYKVLQGTSAKGIGTRSVLDTPCQVAPCDVTKERRLLTLVPVALLGQAKVFRLHGHFALLIDLSS